MPPPATPAGAARGGGAWGEGALLSAARGGGAWGEGALPLAATQRRDRAAAARMDLTPMPPAAPPAPRARSPSPSPAARSPGRPALEALLAAAAAAAASPGAGPEGRGWRPAPEAPLSPSPALGGGSSGSGGALLERPASSPPVPLPLGAARPASSPLPALADVTHLFPLGALPGDDSAARAPLAAPLCAASPEVESAAARERPAPDAPLPVAAAAAAAAGAAAVSTTGAAADSAADAAAAAEDAIHEQYSAALGAWMDAFARQHGELLRVGRGDSGAGGGDEAAGGALARGEDERGV